MRPSLVEPVLRLRPRTLARVQSGLRKWSSCLNYPVPLLTISYSIDLHEDAEKNVITATFELPGLKKEDVSIDVHNNVLTVSGETKQSEERTEGGYSVRERRFGKFSRSLSMAQGVKVCLQT